MLVAPLMTPLLGLGLAISQGNPKLAKMTLKTVFARLPGGLRSRRAGRGALRTIPPVDARDGCPGLAADAGPGRGLRRRPGGGVRLRETGAPGRAPRRGHRRRAPPPDRDLRPGAVDPGTSTWRSAPRCSSPSTWWGSFSPPRSPSGPWASTTRRSRPRRPSFIGGALAITAIVGALALTLAPPRMAPPPAW